MAATEIKVRMQQRRDTALGWIAANPTLLNGELGFETDTYKYKLGNGTSIWTSLPYVTPDNLVKGNTQIDVVDTGSDGHFKVTTEGFERIRIGPAGQIGIAGANYGTSGQVLTSGGASGAVSWVDSTGITVVDGGNFDTGGSAVSTSTTIDGGSFD